MKNYTPHHIQHLRKNQVFVFGSNIAGHHHGGAARFALDELSAIWGHGTGIQGNTYAIPTMFDTLEEIAPYVQGFVNYAQEHPEDQFLLTRVGCGIAGWTDAQMARLFAAAYPLDNVWIPREWEPMMKKAYEAGLAVSAFPPVYSERKLIYLLQDYTEYLLEERPFPEVMVRYAFPEKDCRFHYAPLTEFIYQDDNWYKVDTQGLSAELISEQLTNSNEGVVAQLVIFAGVRTPLKDSSGDYIYTGDVLKAYCGGDSYSFIAAVDAQPVHEEYYALIMDQVDMPITDCSKVERVGTVFFQLQWEPAAPSSSLSGRVVGLAQQGAPVEEKLLTLAKFTPNFDQEEWKYSAMTLLRDEGWFKENEPQ